ncbi:DNA replication/checkpoint protein [Penicillium concentricum]|uniref:DNA replication regulator SLD2 n=1 Tax=Penicillium concentricum TaxID=293559 RepID=A0A9W9S7P5_9EURO|nr:DNA replication/checkpoint protein [Penicillium concentricum]KAJ5372494.1 DNA replication/checkpoint protein [Penicillium concentricum]
MADNVLTSSAEVGAQAINVRAELKTWEKAFASANGGRKAGRNDIKQNADIAAKYKEYSRLKALEASLSRRENSRQEPYDSNSKKRKHASPPGQDGAFLQVTPRKSSRGLFATPSNNRTKQHPAQLDPYDSPSTLRRLFSPSTHRQGPPAPSPFKVAIGPTPQRDGKTLGLFDMLSESGGSGGTPSATRQSNNLTAAFRTPSKRRPVNTIPEDPEEEAQQETPRLARTPASETKQFYLANLFATPTTMRYAAIVEAEDDADAQKMNLLNPTAEISPQEAQSGTPSFLRRSNSGRYPPPNAKHDGPGLSPIVSRKPQRFASKGLTHLVQGLRDMEEDRMEDDWDVMREMEEEAEAEEAAKIQIEDSQAPDVNRKYKKKGQKRTTRRVIMRPVIHQPKPKSNPAPAMEDWEHEDEVLAVPETQQLPAANDGWDDVPSDIERADEAASLHTMSEPELDTEAEFDPDSDDDPEFGEQPKPVARPKTFSERIKEAVSSAAKPQEQEPLGKPPKNPSETAEAKKPRGRKIKPEAHANYRSMNINRGSSRARGRFRRK